MTRTIQVCPGIGDNIWLLMKLVNASEKFNFQLSNKHPRRGKQIFDLLPQVSESAQYVPNLPYKKVETENITLTKPLWRLIDRQSFALSCNQHLEQGHRLERFLPDLPISYRLDYRTQIYKPVADHLLGGRQCIGIYGSAYSTQRAWGFWDEHGWLDLIERVHRRNPEYVFIIIGASWDLDLGRNLVLLLEEKKIPYVNTIGQPLGVVVEMMKQLHYFFSFPSGLGILAPTVNCPVTMFYPKHLKKMMNAWAAPEDIQSGRYKGCQFCTPAQIFDWVTVNNFV